MNMQQLGRWTLINIALIICLPIPAAAQPAINPVHIEPYSVHSGFHDGPPASEASHLAVFRQVIQVPGAQWLRLRFHAYHTGDI